MNRRIIVIAASFIAAALLAVLAAAIGRGIGNMRAANIYNDAIALEKAGEAEGSAAALEGLLKKYPRSKVYAKASLKLASIYEDAGHLLKSKAVCEALASSPPDLKTAKAARKRLEGLNVKILFSPISAPDSAVYTVQPGDTLGKIAAKFGATAELIKKANGLESSVIRAGKGLKVPTVRFSIVVDKSQNTLTLKAGERIFKAYEAATGKDNSTPAGSFKIVNKLTDPVWYTTGAIVPSGSPKNILGSRWLGLDVSGYGIHGTTEDDSIGRQATQGCIRMRNEDVEELYDIVPIETQVTIVD